MERTKVDHLIADSGAFIRNADLYQLGHNIYTCPDVISEIRDKATKQRLATLPYEIKFKSPSPTSIQKVTELSKLTGDYASLSHTDIQLLALTYELTCQYEGQENINENLVNKNKIQLGGSQVKEKELLGFYMPKSEKESEDPAKEVEISMGDPLDHELPQRVEKITLENAEINKNSFQSEEDKSSDEDFGETEHNDSGWITPNLLKEMKKEDNNDYLGEVEIKVACLTTDFAMQNVLIQTNLHLISVDGMQIKCARSYVLRCHACFNITKCMEKVFCPKCGNKTLKRVPVEVQEDGTMKMFFSRNPKVLNPRGLRYSLPTPQGGKHAKNPVICEDQRFPHDRPSKKSLQKTNVWQDDYDCFTSPFSTNEVNSKAFRLGVRGGPRDQRNRRNPNAVGRKFVKRK